jgi:hypothetical protein
MIYDQCIFVTLFWCCGNKLLFLLLLLLLQLSRRKTYVLFIRLWSGRYTNIDNTVLDRTPTHTVASTQSGISKAVF